MMMIVDFAQVEKPFDQVANELAEVGTQMGVQIKCQHEAIFDKMHRI
jgi:ACT domain-containing protein